MNKPLVELERNNAGELFIGVTEFDEEGYGVRSYVLLMVSEVACEEIVRNRFRDLVGLLGDRVTIGEVVE